MSGTKPKILAFAASTRSESFNKKLVRVAAEGARAAGAEVNVIDLRDFTMPIYDGDLEAQQGMPEGARALRRLLMEHQGFLIASPEYNGSLPALLKNAIDWTSRPVDGEDGLAPYRNKVAVLMSTSPGGFGGLRGLAHVRTILANIGVIVLPDQLAVGKAQEVFAVDGTIANDKQRQMIEDLGRTLTTTLARLHGQPLYEEKLERRHDLGRIR
ncbi:NADPH-dependent FMN reductase [Noviherbaspirillum pedocola]|uniref:NAD(P)H-dependent oxidoreductase n=1 Tax=Noviherbaspirillum pedocola TaxID=2801341 RepID=A0A934STI9_9BURK|nr:NAD(P)H-dependent oxidoreductase [Noviherbaspirillum pedocola]MBK4735170.1 NAD(P)H-dependent oxidoreductase [Noviherbaspirillum pedocola]